MRYDRGLDPAWYFGPFERYAARLAADYLSTRWRRHEPLDPHLIVRAASLYIVLALTPAAGSWRRPSPEHRRARSRHSLESDAGALLISFALRCGWWQFDARAASFLAFRWTCISRGRGSGAPCRRLGSPNLPLPCPGSRWPRCRADAAWPASDSSWAGWLLGEALGPRAAIVPGQLFARWTEAITRLAWRATIQVFARSAGLACSSSRRWPSRGARHRGATRSLAGLACEPCRPVAGCPRLSVCQRFRNSSPAAPDAGAVRSTEDARHDWHLRVRRNPMQIAGVCAGDAGAAAVEPVWGLGAVRVSSCGRLRAWDEEEDLRRRFGRDWADYRGHVRDGAPTEAWHDATRNRPASMSPSLRMCREVAAGCGAGRSRSGDRAG